MPKTKASSTPRTSRTAASNKQTSKHIKQPARPASTSQSSGKKTVKASIEEPKLDEVLQIIKLMGSTDLAELELETPDLKISLKRGGSDPVIQMIHAPQGMMTAAPMMQQMVSGAPIPAPRNSSTGGGSGKSATITAPVPPEPPKIEYHKIASPMAGTFYRAPSPSAPPYVKEGDVVKAGQPICIIEAMKLMNEIKADKGGTIIKIPFENAQPVEKGTVLFLIDPNG